MGRSAASLDGKEFTLHGSRYGGCIHGQVLALKGQEANKPNFTLRELFAKGHESEERTKEDMRRAGLVIEHAESDLAKQKEVAVATRFYGYEVWLRSHPDGLLPRPKNSDVEFYEQWLSAGYIRPPEFYEQAVLFEHKLLGKEKFALMLELAPRLIPYIFPALFTRYAWQVSAQSWGWAGDRGTPWSPTFPPPILFSTEEMDTGRRAAYILPRPPFELEQCFGRCEAVVLSYLAGFTPDCDTGGMWCEYTPQNDELDVPWLPLKPTEVL